jgi:hypothetical protein
MPSTIHRRSMACSGEYVSMPVLRPPPHRDATTSAGVWGEDLALLTRLCGTPALPPRTTNGGGAHKRPRRFFPLPSVAVSCADCDACLDSRCRRQAYGANAAWLLIASKVFFASSWAAGRMCHRVVVRPKSAYRTAIPARSSAICFPERSSHLVLLLARRASNILLLAQSCLRRSVSPPAIKRMLASKNSTSRGDVAAAPVVGSARPATVRNRTTCTTGGESKE